MPFSIEQGAWSRGEIVIGYLLLVIGKEESSGEIIMEGLGSLGGFFGLSVLVA